MVGLIPRLWTSGNEVRIEVLRRLAIVTAGVGLLVCWLTLIEWPLPVAATGLGLLLVALSLGARALARRCPD